MDILILSLIEAIKFNFMISSLYHHGVCITSLYSEHNITGLYYFRNKALSLHRRNTVETGVLIFIFLFSMFQRPFWAFGNEILFDSELVISLEAIFKAKLAQKSITESFDPKVSKMWAHLYIYIYI